MLTLADLVPNAARLRPKSMALIGLETAYTWHELAVSTESLGSFLVDAGVRPGDRVAVARHKSHESFISVHAILRSGGVVVPIDPQAPAEAAHQVLQSAGVSAVVGDAAVIESLDLSSLPTPLRAIVASGDVSTLCNQLSGVTAWVDALAWEAGELPILDQNDPAYVMHTSGSTGRPKGIVHTHRSALAYAEQAADLYGLGTHDRLAGMNPLHFDMSTLELYAAPLALAATVVMSEPHLRFPASFARRSAEESVTLWYSVPFLFGQVVDRGGLDQLDLSSLRSVLYGGEPYAVGALTSLFELLPSIEVINVYGPAEVNACCHYVIRDPSQLRDLERVPIGQPWSGTEVRVCSDDGVDVEVGEPGELWVSATTAMTGYWNEPELTAEKFVDRVGAAPPWYRTGDVVVDTTEGLVFLGRQDHQVKVRGVRLELESIESVLTDAPGVAHAVAARVGGAGDSAVIHATIVAASDATIDLSAIKTWCRDRLTPIAVPRELIVAPQLPTGASGKIDRRAVRDAMATSQTESTRSTESPQR